MLLAAERGSEKTRLKRFTNTVHMHGTRQGTAMSTRNCVDSAICHLLWTDVFHTSALCWIKSRWRRRGNSSRRCDQNTMSDDMCVGRHHQCDDQSFGMNTPIRMWAATVWMCVCRHLCAHTKHDRATVSLLCTITVQSVHWIQQSEKKPKQKNGGKRASERVRAPRLHEMRWFDLFSFYNLLYIV